MTRCGYKCRFSLKLPDGSPVRRFGSCRTTDDDNYAVEVVAGKAFLVHLEPSGVGPELDRVELPSDALIAAGYYDHEHAEWLLIGSESAGLAKRQTL